MPRVRICEIKLERRHMLRGVWLCSVTFAVTTANQFTDEIVTMDNLACARWPWLALLRGIRKAKKEGRLLQAKPGEREKRGWV